MNHLFTIANNKGPNLMFINGFQEQYFQFPAFRITYNITNGRGILTPGIT
jgi:hypothetical protein